MPEPEPATEALPVLDPDFGPLTADDAPRRRGMPPRVIVASLLAAVVVCGGLLARGVLSDAGAAVETIPVAARTVGAGQGGALPTGAVRGVAASAMASAGTRLVVHVVGRVRHQGVVTLPAGARVGEAITAAGGAASGAAPNRLNLARRVVDGEQIVVPGPRDTLAAGGAAGGGAGGGGAGGGAAEPAVLDLNTATEAQLDELPGVGPVTAAAIIAWRTQHQRFSRVEELAEVDGIGPKTLERLRPRVRV